MSRLVLAAKIVLGLVAGLVTVALWGAAGFMLCGLSGCGGGGFGRAYAPRWVLGLLLVSGVAAAVVPCLFTRRGRARRALAVAGVVLVVTPVLGALVIGAGPDGYPRSVTRETLEREVAQQRD